MKRLVLILVVTAVSIGATAQHAVIRHGGYRRSHVIISVGRPLYYSPYYYGYYDPFYYPFYPGYVYRYPGETRLELKIDDIRNDYRDKIWSARHDKSLSKAKRKKIIHQLKYERDQAINRAKRDYYKSR
jgi:hypothetical protein